MMDQIESLITEDEFITLWELYHKPRIKKVEVDKEVLGKFLMTHSLLVERLESHGVAIVDKC